MHNGDYPGQAFFGVYKGRKQRVESTYNQLLENIQGYPGAVYEAFMNRSHATRFSETGKVPAGAVPVKPGGSRTMISPGMSRPSTTTSPGVSRTISAPLLELASKPTPAPAPPLELKNKAASMSTVAKKHKPWSAAVGKSTASGSKVKAKSGGLNITAALKNREVHVWTDGSCLGNGKQGATAAYAVYFGQGDPRNEAKRVPGQQTNNTGEIFAVIRALEIVDEGVKKLTIYTDSKYTIECLDWLPGWKRRGGMNSSNKPAVHYAMVKYMDALIKRRRFELVHVRGHQDNEGNNAADELARLAATSPDIPPNRDWELECVKLSKKPLVPVTGSPKITAVDSVQVKPDSDNDSDYGYSDIELGDVDIDGVDAPLSGNPSDRSVNTRDTSPYVDDKPAARKKRSRDEPVEEAPESDVERKVAKKKAKEQPVKCPNCKHKFNVTLRK